MESNNWLVQTRMFEQVHASLFCRAASIIAEDANKKNGHNRFASNKTQNETHGKK
jgi:hypothetical protein